MRKFEKEFIAKIQIGTLVSDDPFKEDYYYQVYSLLESKQKDTEASLGNEESANAIDQTPKWQRSLLKGVLTDRENRNNGRYNNRRHNRMRGHSSSAMSNVQQQMKRLIETRKQKQPHKENKASLEGALGKISASTSKTPKRALQVAAVDVKLHHLPSTDTVSSHKALLTIEDIYASVLRLEDLKRRRDMAEEEQQVPATISEDTAEQHVDVEEAQQEETKSSTWDSKYNEELQTLLEALHIAEEIPTTSEHVLVCTLNYRKGTRLLSRVVPHLSREQVLAIISVILSRFECLKASKVETGTQLQPLNAVDNFMMNIVPLFVNVVSESPLVAVNSLFRVILERHNMVWFAKNRIGLAILTTLLSRAEIIKQGMSNNMSTGNPETATAELPQQPPSEQALGMWGEIYNFLFQSLQGQFNALFPQTKNKIESNQEDVYVWQFLSAVAVGASGIDHQRILVTEVREHVIKASKSGDRKALDNVDLFLNALGLGITAEQLAAM